MRIAEVIGTVTLSAATPDIGGGPLGHRRAIQPERPSRRCGGRWRRPGDLRQSRRGQRQPHRFQRGGRSGRSVPARQKAGGRVLCLYPGPWLARLDKIMNEYKLKEQICEIGRRIYNKGFAAANDGNITVRLNDKEVLCTPTMVSKGFMKSEDICKVDYEGKQLAGTRKRTSEVLLHLAVYKNATRHQRGRPLPSAARHRFRRRPRADPEVRAARGRSFPGRGADGRFTRRRARRNSPRRSSPTSRTATRSSWPITARLHLAPTWKMPTSTPKSSTPIAES